MNGHTSYFAGGTVVMEEDTEDLVDASTKRILPCDRCFPLKLHYIRGDMNLKQMKSFFEIRDAPHVLPAAL